MVLDILYQCADGLRHLHTLGIIHRDVRADNVLVSRRDPILVLISDFGLAHKLQNAAAGVSWTSTTFCPFGLCLNVSLRHVLERVALVLSCTYVLDPSDKFFCFCDRSVREKAWLAASVSRRRASRGHTLAAAPGP